SQRTPRVSRTISPLTSAHPTESVSPVVRAPLAARESRMSEDHFHVHGPHEHEVEHRALHDPFAARVAVMTAIFATIGALMGYMGGATQNDALLFKNEAAIRRTEASDQWNFYQAKSSK